MELNPTRCAICDTLDNAEEIYPATLSPEDFSAAVFSARRLPDRIHFRMVRCRKCDLLRSDPIADLDLLKNLYTASTFDYGDLVPDLRRTYRRYLDLLGRHGAGKGSLLEVGCGNGFFLEEALDAGYAKVAGVEPGEAVVKEAADIVRSRIVCDILRPGLFEADSFDVICFFQVFDHLPDPNSVLEECYRLLKPGGLVLCLNHNLEATSARLLGEKSPIIDVEHTYLYSRHTMAKLFRRYGFKTVRSGQVLNRYGLRYLFRLLPLGNGLKERLMNSVGDGAVSKLRFWVPLGNLYFIARKPTQ